MLNKQGENNQYQSDCHSSCLSMEEDTEVSQTFLQNSIEIFDFSIPLPIKEARHLRIFYNNCNGVEINNTMGIYLKQQKDKYKYNYIEDVEAPTKVDGIIRQMKLWKVDLVCLSEMSVAWEESAPRRVIQSITKQYDKSGCWTVSSSEVKVGGFVKPGGTGMLMMGSGTGRIVDRGTDPSLVPTKYNVDQREKNTATA